jgi:hypothetical protein
MRLSPEERQALGLRLMAVQNVLRDACAAIDDQATLCGAAGENGLAFAGHMLRESVAAHAKEVGRFTRRFIAENGVDE